MGWHLLEPGWVTFGVTAGWCIGKRESLGDAGGHKGFSAALALLGKTCRFLQTGADLLRKISRRRRVRARAVLSHLYGDINRNYVRSRNNKRIRKCLRLITVRLSQRTDPPGTASMVLCHRFGSLTFVFGTSDISDCFLSLECWKNFT